MKARFGALLAACALTFVTTSAHAQEAYSTSDSGQRFRVAFDPASRISIGVSGAGNIESKAAVRPAAIGMLGIKYRGVLESGLGMSRVTWRLDNAFVSGWIAPFDRETGAIPRLDATAYSLFAHRHDLQPSMVLPVSPPIAIPFPFDIALSISAGHVKSRPSATGQDLEIGVARAAVLFDPWRSGEAGNSLSIGAAARYDVDRRPNHASVHRIAPMTAPTTRLALQSSDGLWEADAQGELTPHWASDGGFRLAAEASLHAERTLFALNDQPFTATLDGSYAMRAATPDEPVRHEVIVGLGLAAHLQLR